VTIVYTVGSGSAHDNVELKWSLRSISKYGAGIGDVVVVGYVPPFVNRESVVCIDMDEPSDPQKHLRIFRKIYKAYRELSLTEEFLWSSDDHFYTKPTDFARYPRYLTDWKIPTAEELKAKPKKPSKWRKSLSDTADFFTMCGLPRHNLQGHFNTLFDPAYMDSALYMSERVPGIPLGLNPSLVAGNLKLYHEPHLTAGLVPTKDIKIKNASDMDYVRRIVSEKHVVSCGDGAFDNPEFQTFMESLYPEKCRYER